MDNSTKYTWMESPVGRLLLAGDGHCLRKLLFAEGRDEVKPRPDWIRDDDALAVSVQQLESYFRGELREFNIPVSPEGTCFQQRVWQELQSVGYGETLSYGELARRIGNPAASRAVGLANGANPISIVIPCHRIIGANGRLTGYGGGLPRKEWLLALERRQRGLAFSG